MKNASNVLALLVSYLVALATIFFLVFATLPLRAQSATSVELGTSNVAVTGLESPTGTNSAPAFNAVAAAGTKAQKPSSEPSPVCSDNTGARAGGEMAVKKLYDIAEKVVVFGMLVTMIVILRYFKYRRSKMLHETVRAMIEKGMPITPELIAQLPESSNQPGRSRQRHLLPGLILTGVGTALLITGLGGNAGDGKAGCMVLFMGAAFLIVWFVERRDKNNNQPPK